MEFIDIEPSEQVDEGAWISPRLRPFKNFQAGSVIPQGFNAYARLDHEREGVLPPEVAKALIGVLLEHTSAREQFWLALWDGYGFVYGPGRSFIFMTATGPEPVEPPAAVPRFRFPPFRKRGTRRIVMPDRQYVLYRGAPERVPGWRDGPNLWWPADRAWCVASEIDLPWSYVGGSTELIDAVLSDAGLNARPLSLDETTLAEGNR